MHRPYFLDKIYCWQRSGPFKLCVLFQGQRNEINISRPSQGGPEGQRLCLSYPVAHISPSDCILSLSTKVHPLPLSLSRLLACASLLQPLMFLHYGSTVKMLLTISIFTQMYSGPTLSARSSYPIVWNSIIRIILNLLTDKLYSTVRNIDSCQKFAYNWKNLSLIVVIKQIKLWVVIGNH